jgi:apolipoprotein N-acyltransferase
MLHLCDNPSVRSLLLSGLAGLVLVVAFPPYGQAYLTVPCVAVLFWVLRTAPSRRVAIGSAGVFGLAFFGMLFPWLGELGLEAFMPLWILQSGYACLFGWWAWWVRDLPTLRWAAGMVGGWAAFEAARGRFPFGGFEWGFLGYPMGEYALTRDATQWIGTTGWSVLVALLAAGLALAVTEGHRTILAVTSGVILILMGAGAVWPATADGPTVRVAIIQGSTPCPGSKCADERLRTWQTHLDLTRSLPAGSVDLVVWAEGSSGGFAADPVLIPEVGEAMGAEAARIGAALLAGGDRPINDAEWVNANVVFDRSGTIVGEYRKRLPVPFGEYIPARSFFDWIPALAAVPRDMVPGDGPVAFDLHIGTLGSVVSWEGSFARFSRDQVLIGAELLVVATNQGSYPYSVASDQLIGMTRMRSAELGTDLVHAGVVGRSTIITDSGQFGAVTGLATSEILTGEVQLRTAGPTLFARLGNWLQWLAVLAGMAVTALRFAPSTRVAPSDPSG